MQVALYARVSSARQEHERTIASQVEALEAYAATHGHDIVPDGRFYDDGWSGARLDRPALDALRDAARERAFEAVLIHHPDRLARNYAYQVVLLEEFQRAGVTVIFLEQPPLDDPSARLLVQIQGAVAEYERTKIAKRNRRGRLYRLRQGEVAIPVAPFGYRRVPRTATTPAHLEIDEPHAAVVRQIFTWHAESSWSLRQIASELTRRRVPTPKGGSLWSSSEIRGIVRNTVYAGTWTVNRRRTTGEGDARELRPPEEWITLTVPAVIPWETFERSQQRHRDNQRFSPRNLKTDAHWLVRGLVRCGLCGHSVITLQTPKGRGPGFNRYYRCRHTDRQETLTPCSAPYLRAQELDDLVWAEVGRLLTHPEVLRQSMRDGATVSEESAGVQTQLAIVQRQLATARQERTRLMDAYQAGLLELPDLQRRLEGLDLRAQQWATEVDRLTQLQQAAAGEEDLLHRLDTLAERVRSQLEQLDFAGRQALLREVLDRIEVSLEEMTLYFAIPLPPEDSLPSSDPEVSSKLHLRSSRGTRISLGELSHPPRGVLTRKTRTGSWVGLRPLAGIANGPVYAQAGSGRVGRPAAARITGKTSCPKTFGSCDPQSPVRLRDPTPSRGGYTMVSVERGATLPATHLRGVGRSD